MHEVCHKNYEIVKLPNCLVTKILVTKLLVTKLLVTKLFDANNPPILFTLNFGSFYTVEFQVFLH